MPLQSDWPFGDLRPLSYGAIVADPPWRFKLRSKNGIKKSPQAHYRCMKLEKIKALPVGQLAGKDAVLFLWATAPMLPQAIETMTAWGFTFKSAGAWGKRSPTGRSWGFGTGYLWRSTAEFILLGTIGEPELRSRRERNFIEAPVGDHSEKPEGLQDMVERMFRGPYAELFARRQRPGWDCWGDELESPSRGFETRSCEVDCRPQAS